MVFASRCSEYQEQGPDDIAALMMGYEKPPQGFQLPPNGHYNKYFPGHNIAMPSPLQDGQVTYYDGAPYTRRSVFEGRLGIPDVVAEPHLVQRKRIGLQVMIFLIVLAGLMYFSMKKKVWHDA